MMSAAPNLPVLGVIDKAYLKDELEKYRVEWYMPASIDDNKEFSYLKEAEYENWHIDCFRSYFLSYQERVLNGYSY